MNKIPSEEDFNQASKLMEQRANGLETVRGIVKKHFKSICPMHEFYILPQRDVNYRAYVFYENTNDIHECDANGVSDLISVFVCEKLELLSLQKRGELKIAFEFDSHENVNSKFDGDYFLRMR